MRRQLLAFALFVWLPASAHAQLSLQDCTIPEVEGTGRCGTFRVAEDPARPDGRTIELSVVVLPAIGTARQPDPLFVLQGGPGQGVTQLADFYARLFAPLRSSRDIVLVDLRGTGKSNLLACPQLGVADDKHHFDDQLLRPEAVNACADALARRADVTQYTTEIAMADLDRVRGALGYERINIYGTSYGSYAAQVYLRDFPQRVRTIAMKGVVPLRQIAPLFHARDGELAWRRLVARCAADAACAAASPTLDADMRRIVARLREKPEVVSVNDASRGRVTVTLSAGLFGEVLRNLLYTPENQARVPGVIRQIAKGDFSAVAPLALRTRTTLGGGELSAGFFLSVTCAEGVRDVTDAQVAELTADTFAGDYRLRQQMNACREWPVAAPVKPRKTQLRVDVPVLMLSGELDPVTPPSRGEDVLTYLPQARHVVVANNGHPFGRLEGCGNLLIARMIETGSTQGLDAACARALPAVPFAK